MQLIGLIVNMHLSSSTINRIHSMKVLLNIKGKTTRHIYGIIYKATVGPSGLGYLW